MGAFSYLHSGTPISPAATQLMDTRALPSLSNISNTNGLHQIFWELGHLRVEKESWGLRAFPLAQPSPPPQAPHLKFLPNPCLCLRNIPPTPPIPQELSSALQTLRVFFKVNTFPFLRGILVPTLIK